GGQDGNGNYIFEISGQQDTWANTSFAFDPPLEAAPDSCVIAFASNDILSDPATGFEGNFLEIDNITLDGTMFIVPGGDLNTWENQGDYLTPDGWNVFYSPFDVNYEQSMDANEGDYSILLHTLDGFEGDTVVAAVYQGSIDENGLVADIPMIDDAESLEFWYKYEAAGNDNGVVVLLLSQSLTPNEGDLYFLPFTIPNTPDWTMASLDFSGILDSFNPEYYAILAFSSLIPDMEGSPVPGSNLYLDAFEFILGDGACPHDPSLNTNESVILCPNETLDLSTQMWDAYQWYIQLSGFGDPVPVDGETGMDFQIDGSYAGYTVWCETTQDGCTEPTNSIYIDGYVFAPVVIAGDGTTDLCEGETTELSIPGGPYNTYQWQDNGTDIMGADGSTYTVSETGDYTIVVTPMECPNYEMTNGVPVSIDVHPLPTPVITQNGSVLSVTASYASYQWYLDGAMINGATGSSYTASQDAEYYVVVTDEWGCEGTSDAIDVIIDAILDLQKGSFTLFPNPAEDMITLTVADPGSAQNVELVNLMGEVVYSGQILENRTDISLNGFASGVYFCRVQQSGTIHTTRLVVK
ncbi:MAG: T9SS type A sorting domain-containing protein, partial [Flavobacteriales bacterium]|nr:T9SS type A sorting domain-containing protein [Flavobacteriales bacterium]